MNIESFLSQPEFDNYHKRLQSIQDEIELNSFNLFTISSYNTYLENFHSDVMALLLSPNERHKQGNIYLDYFLNYLNAQGAKITNSDYSFCEITREKGRIDIWIRGFKTKKSIIIENKINDAGDQKNQLESYYDFAVQSGFEVDNIIYLTLSGNKNAPTTDNSVTPPKNRTA